MGTISFAATGDSFITRRLPAESPQVEPIAQLIGGADVRFTNLEVVIRRSEGFPSAESGGTWASAPPQVLHELKTYGFNLLAWATNHTLDYSYGGLSATKRYLDEHSFVHAGAGDNLADASAVKYLECRHGRVACIAATSTCPASWVAGQQRPDIPGRPGVNALRHQMRFRVDPSQLEQLQHIAAVCGINAARDLSVKEGFTTPDTDGLFRFGQHLFEAADAPHEQGQSTRPDARDLDRILRAVDEAKARADMVVVSIHAHEMKNGDKDRPADFLVEFAHACIDRGAHAVIGHGPHILRAVEVYKNRPIFYSLGNFIFQNETVDRLPADFYEKYGLTAAHTTADALNARSGNGTKGLGNNPGIWSSVIARWQMHDGQLQSLDLHPICLGMDQPPYRRGWPRLTQDPTALKTIQTLSREFNTHLDINNTQASWRR